MNQHLYYYHRPLRRTLHRFIRCSAGLILLFLLPSLRAKRSKRSKRRTVLHCKSKLHIYHFGCVTLFCIFEMPFLILSASPKSEGCALQVSPSGGDLEGTAWVYLHRIYIRMSFKICPEYDTFPIGTKMNIWFQFIIMMFHIHQFL